MKLRDQRRQRQHRPYKRKVHFPNGEVWSYRIGFSMCSIRSPDHRQTHKVTLTQITGMLPDDIERGVWKGWWKGVGPQQVKDYIEKHLRGQSHG